MALPGFNAFLVFNRPQIDFVCFTEYDKTFPLAVAFPPERPRNILAEIFGRHGLHNFCLAETEKYAHVTYFFNGGTEKEFPYESRLLIPSPKVATGLLPDLMSAHRPFALIIGFSLGVSLMLGIKSFTERTGLKGVSTTDQPTSLVITAGVDYLVDGFLISIGFVLGAKAGQLLTFALAVEGFFLSLAVSAALSQATVQSTKLVLTASVFAVLLALGAVMRATLFGVLSGPILTVVPAFGAAALIYLVTEELLVEAHEHDAPENPLTTALFFVGFLLLLVVETRV